jgi:hypothetical protein
MATTTKKQKKTRTSASGSSRRARQLDKVAAADTPTQRLCVRLALRLSASDYSKLVELRLALRLGNDAELIRALVRLHHSQAEKGVIKRLRSEPDHKERVATAVNGRRQLRLGF